MNFFANYSKKITQPNISKYLVFVSANISLENELESDKKWISDETLLAANQCQANEPAFKEWLNLVKAKKVGGEIIILSNFHVQTLEQEAFRIQMIQEIEGMQALHGGNNNSTLIAEDHRSRLFTIVTESFVFPEIILGFGFYFAP